MCLHLWNLKFDHFIFHLHQCLLLYLHPCVRPLQYMHFWFAKSCKQSIKICMKLVLGCWSYHIKIKPWRLQQPHPWFHILLKTVYIWNIKEPNINIYSQIKNTICKIKHCSLETSTTHPSLKNEHLYED